MKALVTGGAGFIGSHIAQELCAQNARVVVLDNLSLGTVDNLSWRKSGDDLEFVEGDICNESLLREVMKGCDWVFHKAALPSVPLSVAKPIESNRDTLDGALLALVAARDAGVKRFVFASSSAIYGDSSERMKRESHPPHPLSPYALQKYAAEKYAQLFHQLYGLETVSLRYFNVFGPRQSFDSPYSGVIARFCKALKHGNAPTIFGDGEQSRDFVFIENVVTANLLAAQTPASKVGGKVYNIGTGVAVTLNQLVADLNRLTQQNLKAINQPARAGDIRVSLADISAARSELGYSPEISWEDGLTQTLGCY